MANAITSKQVSFLTSLLAERDIPQAQRDALANLDALSSGQASQAISALLAAPRARKAAPATPAVSPLAEALSKVETSCYAITAEDAAILFQDENFEGADILFFRVKEYRETRYVRRLFGAPGDFATARLSARDALALVKFLAEDTVRHARLFGDHFVVCGKCAAPLTDAESRATGFGPVCRGAFGL